LLNQGKDSQVLPLLFKVAISLKDSPRSALLMQAYQILFQRFGPQHWWPAESAFEVIAGAILTQSAAWTNVEKGIKALKQAGALSPRALRDMPQAELAALIHPCGYYNAKAAKLKAFAGWLAENYHDDLDALFSADTQNVRALLLNVHGIGEETADSILLYAGSKPIFVIDAYTRRIISRLGLQVSGETYRDYQQLFMDNLPHNVQLFNEYHALLVAQGKNACRKKPLCAGCCLGALCESRDGY
jgi:endonuclease III related protein